MFYMKVRKNNNKYVIILYCDTTVRYTIINMDDRSNSPGVENPVELTDITYAKQTIGSIPTLISNRKYLTMYHFSVSFF